MRESEGGREERGKEGIKIILTTLFLFHVLVCQFILH